MEAGVTKIIEAAALRGVRLSVEAASEARLVVKLRDGRLQDIGPAANHVHHLVDPTDLRSAERKVADFRRTVLASGVEESSPGRWLRPDPVRQKSIREMVNRIREENGLAAGQHAHWPDARPGRVRIDRPLRPEELIDLSEHFQAEFVQLTLEDGTAVLVKGPSSGATAGGGGNSVSLAGLRPGLKAKVRKMQHTHPTNEPFSFAASEADRELLAKRRDEFFPHITSEVITRDFFALTVTVYHVMVP